MDLSGARKAQEAHSPEDKPEANGQRLAFLMRDHMESGGTTGVSGPTWTSWEFWVSPAVWSPHLQSACSGQKTLETADDNNLGPLRLPAHTTYHPHHPV